MIGHATERQEDQKSISMNSKKKKKKKKKKKSITLDTTGNRFYSVQNLYLVMEYMLLLNLNYSESLEDLDIQFLFLL
jgi:hypothetical protein